MELLLLQRPTSLIVFSKLPTERIDILIQALLEQLPQSDHSAVIGIKQDSVTVSPPNGPIPSTSLPSYDPSTPFILELCTILTIRDDGSASNTAKQVLDAVHGILRDYGQWHGITISRAAFYGLTILKSGYVCSLMKTAVFSLTYF
jgi:brefeldin A-resistance guanine nucleotide exchange factor 1